MTTYAIIDLDNCISDDRWRRKFIIDNPTTHNPGFNKFHAYHSRAAWDPAGNHWTFTRAERNVIITGRPTFYRPMTEEWLRRQGVPFFRLIMRPDGDHRPSAVLKAQHAEIFIQEEARLEKRADVIAAYDDEPDVVEAYKALNLPAARVFIDERHADLRLAVGA